MAIAVIIYYNRNQMFPHFVVVEVKHGDGGITLWRFSSSAGTGRLIRVKRITYGGKYKAVLEVINE